MSIEEKFQTMETIWDDLCKKEDVFVDLNSAKKNIENSIFQMEF
jgi:hypothetical protein